MKPISHFTNVNGIRLHCLEYGQAGKPPLVCIHGLTRNAHDFDDPAKIFRAKFHVRAIDVRGRGDSGWGPPGEYAIPYYVQDLTALLDQWGWKKVTLVGTSMGGIISMVFAGANPDRVERLVLNDIGPEVEARGVERILDVVINAPREFKDLDDVVTYYRRTYPPVEAWSSDEIVEFAKPGLRETATGALTWKLDPAVRESLRGEGAKGAALTLWEIYDRIKAPVLITRGQLSDVLSAEVAERMIERKPGARLIKIPGVAHAPSLSEPLAVESFREFFTIDV